MHGVVERFAFLQRKRIEAAAREIGEGIAKLGATRAQLARESRAFFQKSFQMGETDLPTRLRMERERACADLVLLSRWLDRAEDQPLEAIFLDG